MNTTSNYAFLLMAADNLAVSVNLTSPSWLFDSDLQEKYSVVRAQTNKNRPHIHSE